MPDKISILKESGETLSSNVVSVFMIPDTEKKYIITTENAVDPHGLTVLHVSEIVDGALQKIATDDEWSSIKTIMRAIISGNVGSYQYLPTIESINASGQYSRDISVSASASKQMIDNYAAGEKSNISVTPETAPAPEAVQAPAPDAAAPAAPATQPSIFPTGNAEVANDDELIPGISEVGAAPANPASVPVDNTAVPVAQPVVQPQPAVAETPQVVPAAVPPVTPVEVAPSTPEVVPPVAVPAPENVSPAVAVDNAVVQPVVVNPEPVVAIPTPVVAEAAPVNNLSNEVQVVPGIPEQPVVSNVSTMTASNIQVNNDLIAPTPVVVSTEPEPIPVVPVMPDASQPVPAIPVVEPEPAPVSEPVQVVQPAVAVPTAQIAQEAQPNVVPEVKIDATAAPSFSPDATLDQVVVAAQEMFMEGVKNLVQTIQEKVYRDLYNKDNELKAREEMLLQREKMINDQMMAMMNNFAALQGKSLTVTDNDKKEDKKEDSSE